MPQDYKEKITTGIENAFDKAHRVADTLTYPLGPVDAVAHGVFRGVHNWLLDKHPSNGGHGNHGHHDGSSSPPSSHGSSDGGSGDWANSVNSSKGNFSNNQMKGNSNIKIGGK